MWRRVQRVNVNESTMANYQRDKLLKTKEGDKEFVIQKVQKPMEYLDKVAQSSESLPNDYSTNSLLKNTG